MHRNFSLSRKFADARELRKVGKIVGSESEVTDEAINGFLNETMSLDEAVELVESDSKIANLTAKIRNFNIAVSNESTAIDTVSLSVSERGHKKGPAKF